MKTEATRKQFQELKAKHPDAVILFRCGDFYESYEEDAKIVAFVCGIVLHEKVIIFEDSNKKEERYYQTGFPHHALDIYLPKLIRAGRRIAICDQLEDPRLTKKLVKRGITELVK